MRIQKLKVKVKDIKALDFYKEYELFYLNTWGGGTVGYFRGSGEGGGGWFLSQSSSLNAYALCFMMRMDKINVYVMSFY